MFDIGGNPGILNRELKKRCTNADCIFLGQEDNIPYCELNQKKLSKVYKQDECEKIKDETG